MLPLDDYLPYLLNRAGSRLAEAFSAVVRDYGITLPMWRVLAALHQKDGERVGRIAELTAIEVSTLSRLLDTMEARGLVVRRRSADDARTVAVQRTAAGRELTATIIPLALHYEAVALKGLSARETTQLKRMLRRLYANMAELEAERAAESRAAG